MEHPVSKRQKFYVGCQLNRETGLTDREVFKSAEQPTDKSYVKYDYCIGPFKTKRGAKYAVEFPYAATHVDQFERKAKRDADRI